MSKEPEPCAPGRPARRVIDWHQAAELLAQGMTTAQAAARVGCSRGALARKRRHDPIFQNWTARCREAAADSGTQRFADLRLTLEAVIAREVRAGNVRVTLWLADRLKLVTPPNERTPDQELRQILGGLTSEELREFESLRDEAGAIWGPGPSTVRGRPWQIVLQDQLESFREVEGHAVLERDIVEPRNVLAAGGHMLCGLPVRNHRCLGADRQRAKSGIIEDHHLAVRIANEFRHSQFEFRRIRSGSVAAARGFIPLREIDHGSG